MEEYIKKNISVKTLFKLAFTKNKITQFIGMAGQVSNMINNLTSIESIRENNPHLEYAQTIEITSNLNLDPKIIASFEHNKQEKTLLRILYFVKWYFKLNLVDNWEETLKISVSNLQTVTQKPKKLQLYIDYIDRYRDCIHKAIEFRKKHYDSLQEKMVKNYFNNEFIFDFNNLFNNMIKNMKLYTEFKNSLNWLEYKRFKEYNEREKGKFPALVFRFNCGGEKLYCSNN